MFSYHGGIQLCTAVLPIFILFLSRALVGSFATIVDMNCQDAKLHQDDPITNENIGLKVIRC